VPCELTVFGIHCHILFLDIKTVLYKTPLNVYAGAHTLCPKKVYHPSDPTTNDNFNSSCPISVILGMNIIE